MDLLNEDELYRRLKKGEYRYLDQLYLQHRDKFLTYAQRNLYASEEDAADSFQDAVIALYKNILGGSFEKKAQFSTYLFAIAKRHIYRRNGRKLKEVATDHEDGIALADDPADGLDLSLMDRFEDEHRQQMLRAAMSRLGERCRELLTLTFYHRYHTESIMESLGFSSPGAVRIAKMRCLQKLKDLL